MVKYILIILLGISTFSASAAQMVDISVSNSEEILVELGKYSGSDNTQIKPKYRKLKVVLLTILLGHFGVHRIYLGTSANVPVVYSATLGGGLGILPLLDLVAILSTKDWDRFENNNQVFMWSKKTNQ